MNRSNLQTATHAAKQRFNSLRNRAAAMGTTAMVVAGSALASGPDTSAIEAEFATYKTAVIALVIGFAVVLWAIKASGLLKPR